MLKLITDRTSSDVTRAKQLIEKAKKIENLTSEELEEYLSGLKGCYNISDLNRVEEAVQYVSDLLNSHNYYNVVNVKEWKPGDLLNQTELIRYLNNLDILKNAYITYSTTPDTPISYQPYGNANNIEKILLDLEQIFTYMHNYIMVAGVKVLGQTGVNAHKFRTLKNMYQFKDYAISQIPETDNLAMYCGESGDTINKTNILSLPLPTNIDKVKALVDNLNNSMVQLDNLIGVSVIKKTLTNLIPDPSFELDYWDGANYSTIEKIFGNRSLYFQTGTTYVPNIEIERPIVGHKYYGRRYIKTNGNNEPGDSRFEVWGADGENMNWVYAWNDGNHSNWEFNSTIHEIASVDYPETDRTIIRCFNVNTTADTWVDGLMLIDLSEAFGEGLEPTQEWCDNNIPYFEGTKGLYLPEY